MSKQKRTLTPIANEPVAGLSIEGAVDKVYAAAKQAEFEEVVRLAEQVFPNEWNVRVEPYSDGVHIQVRYFVAHGPDAITALRSAIDWYQNQKQSRIILPTR